MLGRTPLKQCAAVYEVISKCEYPRLAEDFSSEGGERCIALYSYSGEAESSMGLQVPRFDRHLLICHYRQWQYVLYKLALKSLTLECLHSTHSRREKKSQWRKETTEDGHECAGSNNINMTSTSWHNHNYLGHHHNNNTDDPHHHYPISSSWTRLCRGGSGEEGYVPTAYLQWLT